MCCKSIISFIIRGKSSLKTLRMTWIRAMCQSVNVIVVLETKISSMFIGITVTRRARCNVVKGSNWGFVTVRRIWCPGLRPRNIATWMDWFVLMNITRNWVSLSRNGLSGEKGSSAIVCHRVRKSIFLLSMTIGKCKTLLWKIFDEYLRFQSITGCTIMTKLFLRWKSAWLHYHQNVTRETLFVENWI